MAKRRRRNYERKDKHITQNPCFITIISNLWERHGILKDEYANQLQNNGNCLEILNQMIKEGYIWELQDIDNEIRLVLSYKGLHGYDFICKTIQKIEGLESSRYADLRCHFYKPRKNDSTNPRRPEIILEEKRFDILCVIEQSLLAVRLTRTFYGQEAIQEELDVTQGELPNLYYQVIRTLKVLDDQLVNQHRFLEKEHILERIKSPKMKFYNVMILNSMTFIRFMTITEFIFKQYLLYINNLNLHTKTYIEKVKNNKPQTLGILVSAFEKDKYFNNEIITLLRNANVLRNLEVHNNAVAQQTQEICFGDYIIYCEQGKDVNMMEIDHMIVIMHMKKVIDSFYNQFVEPYSIN